MISPHRVAILCHPNTALFELGCATELFALPREEFDNWYQTDVVTLHSEPVSSIAGIRLEIKRVRSLAPYHSIVIPSWPIEEPVAPAHIQRQLLKAHESGKRLLSFCSGAYLLASTGLLDGRSVTTHWRYAEHLRNRFPNLRIVDNVLFVLDDNIGCSAGSSAALDLGLEVIRQDFGHGAANSVARRLVLSAHRSGGQSQYEDAPRTRHPDKFAQSLDWAMANLHRSIGIDEFASRANMSRRSFDRRFRSALNLSPKAWIIQQRVYLAREFLERPAKPIEEVAFDSGFNTAETLRHHFRRLLGISPSQFRQQFMQRN